MYSLALSAAVLLASADVEDYQRLADSTSWAFPIRGADAIGSALRCGSLQTEIIRLKGANSGELTIRLSHGKRALYQWKGHELSVFRVEDDVVYYADFRPTASGCTLVAYDLKAKKERWRTALKALGPIAHSKYSNQVAFEVVGSNIRVFGNESSGRYVEFVDRATGRTRGSHVYAP